MNETQQIQNKDIAQIENSFLNSLTPQNIGALDNEDQELKSTLEKFRMDNSDVIRDIDLELRGYEKDLVSNVWTLPKEGLNKFNMSDECRKFVISSLRLVMHKANVQGNLSTKYNGELEYTWKVDGYAQAFEEHLIYHAEDYNINISTINYLSVIYQETIRTFFTRLLGDGERKRDKNEQFKHDTEQGGTIINNNIPANKKRFGIF